MITKKNVSIEEISCNICHSTDAIVILRPERTARSFMDVFSAAGGVRGTQTIVKCRRCGLVYVSPRFKPENIIKAYTETLDHGYSTQMEGRNKTFENGVILLNKYYPQKGKLLDVGCANGGFLKMADKHGWDTYGVEPSRELAVLGKRNGLKIYQGTLDEQKFTKNKFDVITYWDVLEHVADPMRELKLVYSLLKPGGILLVNFPDIGSLPARLSGKYWWFLLSVHLFYFSKESLVAALSRCRLKTLYCRAHWQYLELGYILGMLSLYNKPISKSLRKLTDLSGLSSLLIPYYAGQTTLIAKKT